MKRILFVLFLLVAAVTLNAQFATSYVPSGSTTVEYSTDVTLTNAVAQYWLVKAPQPQYTAQCAIVQLDSLAGNHTNVAIALYGRYTSADAWAAVGSAINWKGTTSDTTIVYLNATENGYREFKLLFTGTGTGTTTIDNVYFKQWLGIP